jgi:hypothetical protein
MKLISHGSKHTLYDDKGFVKIITRTKSIVLNFVEKNNGSKEEKEERRLSQKSGKGHA